MSLLGETAKILYKTGLCRFFSIQQEGFKLKFFPTKMSKRLWISAIQKKNPYEVLDKFFTRHLKQGDIVIDAGANIGYYSLLSAAVVGASGYVYAIEAHPKTFSYLQKNIDFNTFENIQCFHTALGNESGEIKFSNKDSDDLNQVDSAGEISVPIIKLDDLPISNARINLLKVDVEGYEKFVLQGAAELLDRTDVILFESWDQHYRKFDYSLNDILAHLTGYGFLFMTYNENGFSEIENDYGSLDCEDIVAVRDIKQFLESLG
ncbi:MAG: FkbM family methyltransferase [Porticoccus sp.]|jgi:FkbM family methyltransferase